MNHHDLLLTSKTELKIFADIISKESDTTKLPKDIEEDY